MGWWGHGWNLGLGGWEALLIGGLMMMLFWGGLIVLGLLTIRALWGRNSQPDEPSEDLALAILGRRYAAGEIDADTYREMKETLRA